MFKINITDISQNASSVAWCCGSSVFSRTEVVGPPLVITFYFSVPSDQTAAVKLSLHTAEANIGSNWS